MDDINDNDINDAKLTLMHNMHAIYAEDDVGHRARQYAIKAFKKQHSIKFDDIALMSIEADLANDIDISNFLKIDNAYDREASSKSC